ncbi:hypothetical protein DA2_2920 [Desulfovibrio sp. A2]|nr:hypothetical protein DA2_2920 [Desulfovibrio sp. A2]
MSCIPQGYGKAGRGSRRVRRARQTPGERPPHAAGRQGYGNRVANA